MARGVHGMMDFTMPGGGVSASAVEAGVDPGPSVRGDMKRMLRPGESAKVQGHNTYL